MAPKPSDGSAVRALVAQAQRELEASRLPAALAASLRPPELSAELERLLRERRAEIVADWAGAPAEERAQLYLWIAERLRDFFYREHQYLDVDARREQQLAALAARATAALAASLASPAPWPAVLEELRGQLHEQRGRLREIVLELLGESGPVPDAAGASPRVVCAEYSPELQLRVLGLDPEKLETPILDLGCGASGALVLHLRALGRAPVLGIDRSAPEGAGFVRASWFDAPLPPGTLGTVIAHQSFSLHFVHAHLYAPEARAQRFAAKYVEILRSLAPGGRFVYAPGLPFIEQHLDAEAYRVESWPVGTSGVHAAAVERRV